MSVKQPAKKDHKKEVKSIMKNIIQNDFWRKDKAQQPKQKIK